ncbi:MAG: DUF1285 domain-containing protein [Pseudomonadota bacterium]
MPNHNESLESIVEQFSGRELPPVASWSPDHERDIDMRIDASGRWFYHGSAIERMRMVALFSTILRRDGDDYSLVTPAEKLRIVVEDVPFVAQILDVSGSGTTQQLRFTDNVGNQFLADPDHRLWIEHGQNESRPYVIVRDNLAALIARPVYYQLAELLVETADGPGVHSGGVFFPLG